MSANNPFCKQVANALEKSGLLDSGSRLLVAVSGGADSVALLRAVVELAATRSFSIVAAHLNHGIRDEAVNDADFVQALCSRLSIDLHRESVDVPSAAQQSGQSIEMQAREMRYAFLQRIATCTGANAILTAHTRNDQAETLLLNLCRGAGPSALGGIPPDTVINGCRLVRPLLTITRDAIERYLQSRGQDWCEDGSNQNTRYQRNAVRHQIIPLLREVLNPQATDALARAADILYADNQLLDQIAATQSASAQPPDTPDILWLMPYRQLPLAVRRRLITSWLQAAEEAVSLRFDLIARIDALAYETAGGGCIRVSPSLEIRHEYDRLRRLVPSAEHQSPPHPPVLLNIPGMTNLPGFGCTVEAHMSNGFAHEPAITPGDYPVQIHIQYDPASPVCIRARQRKPGDRIAMIGMKGEKKLQDILTDAKVPAAQRDMIPVFVIDNEVIWMPGCRPSRHWAVLGPDSPSLRIRVSRNDRT